MLNGHGRRANPESQCRPVFKASIKYMPWFESGPALASVDAYSIANSAVIERVTNVDVSDSSIENVLG